jgi:hypothetical protein
MPTTEGPQSPLEFCDDVLTKKIPRAVETLQATIDTHGIPKALRQAGHISTLLAKRDTGPWIHRLTQLLQTLPRERIRALKDPLDSAQKQAKEDVTKPEETAVLREKLSAGSEAEAQGNIDLLLRAFEIEINFWKRARSVLETPPATAGEDDTTFTLHEVPEEETDPQATAVPVPAASPQPPAEQKVQPRAEAASRPRSGPPLRRMTRSVAAEYMARVRADQQAEKKESWFSRKLREWGFVGKPKKGNGKNKR